jgi:hypothetical protein
LKRALPFLFTPLMALAVAPPGHADTKAKPCGCKDLPTVEQHLREQEFLHRLFAEWSGRLPGTILDTKDMQDRAVTLLNLTFYGAKSQAPQKNTSGARADLGTDITKESCPIVLYHYKGGKPVMKREGGKLVQETSPISEEEYEPNGQCAALVHYGFVHEKQHKDKCDLLVQKHKTELWHLPAFFAGDDAAAYEAGSAVLREERDKLRRECPEKPDGKWHGKLIYGYAYLDNGKEVIKKGDDIVYRNGSGVKTWGDHRSKRLQAWINAAELDGEMRVAYSATAEKNVFARGHFEIPGADCGWYRKLNYVTEHSNEEMESGAYQGVADAFVTLSGNTIQVSLTTARLKGTRQKRDWVLYDGHCQKKNDFKRHDDKAEQGDLDAIHVALEGKVDPDHPNDILVTKVLKGMGGKQQEYIELRLHREVP